MLSPSDYGCAWTERAEIYDLVRDAKITGFAIVSGDRHSFWAGYATSQLPPGKFEPVGLSFVGASLSSAGTMEALRAPSAQEVSPAAVVPRRTSRLRRSPTGPTTCCVKHGVRSCLEYAKSFDLERARAVSNPELSPHLEFVDTGGHGYAKVRLTGDEMRTEFVCIPRPITRSERARRRATSISRRAYCQAVGRGRTAASSSSRSSKATPVCPSSQWQPHERRAGTGRRCASRRRLPAGC